MRYKYENKKRKYRKMKPRVGRIAILVVIMIAIVGLSVFGVKSLMGILNPPKPHPIALYVKDTSLFNEKARNAKEVVLRDFAIGKELPSHKPLPADMKIACLTFDDGPGYESTDYLLGVLKKYDIKATFFVLGSKAEQNPEMLKKIIKAGHEVASHSYDHPDLTKLSPAEVKQQLDRTDEAIRKAGGKTTTLLRPPYGNYSKEIEETVGKDIFLWTVDSNDWRFKGDPQGSADTVLGTVQPQAVILYHDIYNSSVKSAEIVIPKLKEMGYEFVTASKYMELTGEY